MDPRYPYKWSPYSSHSQIAKLLGQGHGRKLLDIGCSDGALGSVLQTQGWQVFGVEPYEEDAENARGKGLTIFEMTMEQALEELEFDFSAVVLADTLEHCVDPWENMANLRRKLAPRTRLAISLPNVAHVYVRAQLLVGTFRYEPRGLLDATHLRFFTNKTAKSMILDAGFQIESSRVTATPLELLRPSLAATRSGKSVLEMNWNMSRLMPGLLGYQRIYSAIVPQLVQTVL